MIEKPELKIPEDYKEPLEKQILWDLDCLPDKIRDKEIEIIEYNREGLKQNKIIQERGDLILKMMRKEGKYKEGTQQFAQVHSSRLSIDEMARKANEEKIRLDMLVNDEKINLNYILNKFKGSQVIGHRKAVLEKS